MNTILHQLSRLGLALHPYLSEIAIAMVACLLVVLGSDINRFLRRHLRGHNFVVRTAAFVIVNAFGYGFVIVTLSPWLAGRMATIPGHALVILVVATFLLVGSWAQRHHHV